MGIVNSALRGSRGGPRLVISGSGPTWIACVIGHAGSPPAGPAIASTDSSTANARRTPCASLPRRRQLLRRYLRAAARNSRMYGPYSLARAG